MTIIEKYKGKVIKKVSNTGISKDEYNALTNQIADGKNLIANAIGEPEASNDTFEQLGEKIENITSDLKNSLAEKGIDISDNDSLSDLTDKVKEVAYIEGFSALPQWYSSNMSYTNKWYECTKFDKGRTNLKIDVIDNKIYLTYSTSGSSVLSAQCYDPDTDTFVDLASAPTYCTYYTVSAADNKLYVISGMNSSGTVIKTNQCYNPATNKWTTKTSITTGRESSTSSTVNNKIYVMGGMKANESYATTVNQCYDPLTNAWTGKASMKQGIYIMSSCALNDIIYVLSGTNGSNKYYMYQYYDTVANAWTSTGSIDYTHKAVCATVNNKIYVMGGNNLSGYAVTTNKYYDHTTNTFTTLASVSHNIDCGMGDACAVANKIYIMGADNGNYNSFYIP